jgi:hypothetical protein
MHASSARVAQDPCPRNFGRCATRDEGSRDDVRRALGGRGCAVSTHISEIVCRGLALERPTTIFRRQIGGGETRVAAGLAFIRT